jgi:hypothetical protein
MLEGKRTHGKSWIFHCLPQKPDFMNNQSSDDDLHYDFPEPLMQSRDDFELI